MQTYKHTQPGTLMQIGFGSLMVLTLALAAWTGRNDPKALLVFGLVSLALGIGLALFYQLTVTVAKDFIRLRFGVGVINKKFAIEDVESASVVRNKWWYGWGIRITPHGWLYNVGGYDAVELRLKNGRKVRVGTDQPKRLLAAIEAALLTGSGSRSR